MLGFADAVRGSDLATELEFGDALQRWGNVNSHAHDYRPERQARPDRNETAAVLRHGFAFAWSVLDSRVDVEGPAAALELLPGVDHHRELSVLCELRQQLELKPNHTHKRRHASRSVHGDNYGQGGSGFSQQYGDLNGAVASLGRKARDAESPADLSCCTSSFSARTLRLNFGRKRTLLLFEFQKVVVSRMA